MAIKPTVGASLNWKRTITEEDIVVFTGVSGDRGRHHVEKDQQGRLLAQGLLTATLPTKLGGDLNYIAATMTFNFKRPVYAGDILECAGIVDRVEEEKRRWKVSFSFRITNQHGKLVLDGDSAGRTRTDQ